jgi:hypothetical protein
MNVRAEALSKTRRCNSLAAARDEQTIKKKKKKNYHSGIVEKFYYYSVSVQILTKAPCLSLLVTFCSKKF